MSTDLILYKYKSLLIRHNYSLNLKLYLRIISLLLLHAKL